MRTSRKPPANGLGTVINYPDSGQKRMESWVLRISLLEFRKPSVVRISILEVIYGQRS
jgi:hypothetical protein